MMHLDFSNLSGPAATNLQSLKFTSTVNTLAPFQFELMEQGIEARNTANKLRRVNNITWHMMKAWGFAFDEAIKAAAEWVIHNEARHDEAALVDVMALFNAIK